MAKSKPESSAARPRTASASATKTAAKKTAAKKTAAAKTAATKTAATKTAATKTAATKSAAKKTAATKTAATKPAAAKPAAAKTAATSKAPSLRRVATRRAGPAPIDTLGASDVLARIVLFARSEEDLGEEMPRLIERLEQTADASLVPAMIGALDDDDPHGALWSVFYLLESFDDDYLAGLIAALPELADRSPRWAETAVLRIVNTHGEPEDCTDAFVAIAQRQRPPSRKRTSALLARMGKTNDGLHTAQRKILADLARAVNS